VRERLRAGADGELPETPTAGDPAFDRSAAFVVGNGRTALDAAATAAADRGYEPLVLSASVRGEAREAGTTHAAIAEECRPRVADRAAGRAALRRRRDDRHARGRGGSGDGRPEAEFAASAGLALAEGPLGTAGGRRGRRPRPQRPRVVVASADTDGLDGPTDAAGAIADATTLDPDAARDALDRHDAYPLFDDAGALLRTGPTGTNVNDLRAIVVEKRDGEEGRSL